MGSARRLEVHDRIVERFGAERVAVTDTPGTYRPRHPLRDTGLGRGLSAERNPVRSAESVAAALDQDAARHVHDVAEDPMAIRTRARAAIASCRTYLSLTEPGRARRPPFGP